VGVTIRDQTIVCLFGFEWIFIPHLVFDDFEYGGASELWIGFGHLFVTLPFVFMAIPTV
jgi:hypothetical protein